MSDRIKFRDPPWQVRRWVASTLSGDDPCRFIDATLHELHRWAEASPADVAACAAWVASNPATEPEPEPDEWTPFADAVVSPYPNGAHRWFAAVHPEWGAQAGMVGGKPVAVMGPFADVMECAAWLARNPEPGQAPPLEKL